MKNLLLSLSLLTCLEIYSQMYNLDFGTSINYLQCTPPTMTTTNQQQCVDSTFINMSGLKTYLYYTTDAGTSGIDCINWFSFSNHGHSFIGSATELQLRGAGGGNTMNMPPRFVVKDFNPTNKFFLQFDFAIIGFGGEFIFRCGSGPDYGKSMLNITRDDSSFMAIKIDDGNYSTSNPKLKYSQSLGNLFWPNSPTYNWGTGNISSFTRYNKHTVSIYCNNTNDSIVYNYLSPKILTPRSYDVYIDSVLDVSNRVDSFFPVNKKITSFMFYKYSSICANSGLYFGDTLILDNLKWSTFSNTVLPVQLIDFSCKRIDRNILLSWETASEKNSNYFEIQRSYDGIVWDSIGIKKSIGNSKEINKYSFIDKSSLLDGVYYKLKQVDLDGRSEVFKICSISNNIKNELIVFPNPINSDINFSKSISGSIINTIGKEIYSFISKSSIDLPELSSGVYILEYIDENIVYQIKLIKQ